MCSSFLHMIILILNTQTQCNTPSRSLARVHRKAWLALTINSSHHYCLPRPCPSLIYYREGCNVPQQPATVTCSESHLTDKCSPITDFGCCLPLRGSPTNSIQSCIFVNEGKSAQVCHLRLVHCLLVLPNGYPLISWLTLWCDFLKPRTITLSGSCLLLCESQCQSSHWTYCLQT